jgi:Sec-independent protein translocase protein TatA
MSTQIGEVNISLRMSLAQFKQDTADGTKAATKSIKEMGETIKGETGEARESLRLLGEEVGVHLPRGITNFISTLPGVGSAMAAAFSAVAIIGLISLIVEGTEKLNKFLESLTNLSEEEKSALRDVTTELQKSIEFAKQLQTTRRETVLVGKTEVEQAQLRAQWAAEDADSTQKNYERTLKLYDTAKAIVALEGQTKPNTSTFKYKGQANSDIPLVDNDQIKQAKATIQSLEDAYGKDLENLSRSVNITNADAALAAAKGSADAAEAYRIAQEKSEKQLTKLSDAVFNLKTKLGVPATLQINAKVDPQLFEVGALLDKLAAPPLPVYSGTKENEDAYKLSHDQATQIAEAQKVYTATRTGAEQLAEEQDKLDTLWLQGRISLEDYTRAMDDANKKYDETTKAAQQFGQDIGDTIKQSLLFGRSWSDTLKSVALDLAQLILKMTLFKNLSASTGSGSGGGFFASLIGGLAGVSGGTSAPGRAAGGPVDAGQVYQWNEHGKEYFVPKSDGTVIPAGASASSSKAVQQNFNMTINGVSDVDSFRKSQSQIAAEMYAMMATAARRNG